MEEEERVLRMKDENGYVEEKEGGGARKREEGQARVAEWVEYDPYGKLEKSTVGRAVRVRIVVQRREVKDEW